MDIALQFAERVKLIADSHRQRLSKAADDRDEIVSKANEVYITLAEASTSSMKEELLIASMEFDIAVQAKIAAFMGGSRGEEKEEVKEEPRGEEGIPGVLDTALDDRKETEELTEEEVKMLRETV